MHYFRVLVVDDEKDFVEATVKRLNKRGIDAEGVLSGEQALELMKKSNVTEEIRHYSAIRMFILSEIFA